MTPGKVARRLAGISGIATAVILVAWPAAQEAVLKRLFPGEGSWIYPRATLLELAGEHLALALSASLAAALIGTTLGVLATRPRGRPFLPLIRDIASLAQTFPPAAVLALAIPFLGFGFRPALLALVLYSVLPVINNTITGIENLPPPVLEAAKGMGMSRRQSLFRVELPLALPSIGTGVRTSAVINMGTATLGALAGAGGLGSPIVAGLVRDNTAWVFQGAAASAGFALALNALLKAAERRIRVRGGNS